MKEMERCCWAGWRGCGGGEKKQARDGEREGETKAVERRWEQLGYNAELMCPIKHPILQTWQIVLP